jgi:hypothetical protein
MSVSRCTADVGVPVKRIGFEPFVQRREPVDAVSRVVPTKTGARRTVVDERASVTPEIATCGGCLPQLFVASQLDPLAENTCRTRSSPISETAARGRGIARMERGAPAGGN